MTEPLILYAGDGPAKGPARYLLAILHAAKIQSVHIPPGRKISNAILRQSYGAFIFSDYSHFQLTSPCEKIIAKQVRDGAGLLMVGGWGSFSGPFGGWKNSLLESLLPVQCQKTDDRQQFPSGAWIRPASPHWLTQSVPWSCPPMICGLNKVRLRRSGKVLLSAAPLKKSGPRHAKFEKSIPLLVVDSNEDNRRAAFLTDFAPHWSAGFLDWGRRTTVRGPGFGEIQAGSLYLQFGISLARWLIRDNFLKPL